MGRARRAKGPDIVNGANWAAGFTGTQTSHGKRVSPASIRGGDLAFYADKNGKIGHVAIYVGDGKVVSHGQSSGPSLVPLNYRPVVQVRRYLP